MESPKLIGYGLFSLAFRPPFCLPNSQDLSNAIQKEPERFVGLITTRKQYQKKIKRTTEILKQLSSKHPDLSHFIVLPYCLNGQEDFLLLANEMVQQLMEVYHPVRKRVEYEETWDPQELIQMIYPYAGTPLAQVCKDPAMVLSWETFFQGMMDITRFLLRLHGENYVHGDLSPNNFLYEEGDFKIVDWNMLSLAENFVKHRKGPNRVGCWSPEHFSLTSSRLKEMPEDQHWTIYAEEMRKYIERLLNFRFASQDESEKKLREYLERKSQDSVLETMYENLRMFARIKPSLIGKYHDMRYFMDTIAKCVYSKFPEKTEAQQKQYNAFVSLCLVQNVPERKAYLEKPDRLTGRLEAVLHGCRDAIHRTDNLHPELEAEQSILNLLM